MFLLPTCTGLKYCFFCVTQLWLGVDPKNINKNLQRSPYIAWLLQRTLNDKYAVFKIYVWCIKKSKCNEKHIQKTLRTRKHHRKKKNGSRPWTAGWFWLYINPPHHTWGQVRFSWVKWWLSQWIAGTCCILLGNIWGTLQQLGQLWHSS